MSWKDVFAGTCGGISVTLVGMLYNSKEGHSSIILSAKWLTFLHNVTYTGHPFDTVKVRLQTQPTEKPLYNGVADCVKKTIQVSVRKKRTRIKLLSQSVKKNLVYAMMTITTILPPVV